MTIKTKIGVRKTVQITVFLFFLLTVLQANYPYSPLVPPELFLWLDPLSGWLTMTATHTFIPWFLLSLLTLLSPLLVGRSFCGWICPLGTIIDTTDHLVAPGTDNNSRRFRFFKTVLLLFFLITAILGSQLAWFLDPLPLLWRTFGAVIFPAIALGFHLILSFFIYLKLDGNWLYSSFDWINLHFLPLKSVVVEGAFGIGLIFSSILLLSRISRRFWCRNLCPLGALLGILARFSPLQRHVDAESCTECGDCRQGCKMNAIEEDYLTTEKGECIFCLNCGETCAFESITFPLKRPAEMLSPVDLNKRRSLSTLTAALTSVALLKLSYHPEKRSDWVVRPPGAVDENQFLDRCIRCNECVRICSTTGACLQPLHFEAGIEGFWTPYADFTAGYCEYQCNLCGQICPTGAIRELSLKDKQSRVMGLAFIDKNRCIPYREAQNCIVCEEHCPTPEKAIVFDEKEIPSTIPGLKKTLLLPVVKMDLCIGCGICENKCPVDGHPGISVSRNNEQRL